MERRVVCRLGALALFAAISSPTGGRAAESAGSPASAGSVPNYSVVHAFDLARTRQDGSFPQTGVIHAPDGTLYGTTRAGGAFGSGSIFKIAPDGTEVLLRSFSGPLEGGGPAGLLVLGQDGRLYGSLSLGGRLSGGVNFRIDADGSNFISLHDFQYSEDGGSEAWAPIGLVLGRDGNFYGTSQHGGSIASYGDGTLYRMTPEGRVTILHRFAVDQSEGSRPLAALIQTRDGALVGTTSAGGAHGFGTVFRMGRVEGFRLLDSFSGSDGAAPHAPLFEAESGLIYGVSPQGGDFGKGTAFRLTRQGRIHVLHHFGNSATGGAVPYSGLAGAIDGTLYGTTVEGGRFGRGTVYRMSVDGDVKVIAPFGRDPTDGFSPAADRLAIGTDGALFGVCTAGGLKDDSLEGALFGNGVVFRLDPATGR